MTTTNCGAHVGQFCRDGGGIGANRRSPHARGGRVSDSSDFMVVTSRKP
jgi:hypothetical protein